MSISFMGHEAEAFAYPGGEVSVRFAQDCLRDEQCVALLAGADPADLLALVSWGRSVRRLGGVPQVLLPYLPAARADHDDQPVGFDAAWYAGLLGLAKIARIVTVDPHSRIMPLLIRAAGPEVVEIPLPELVWSALPPDFRASLTGVIIPDKGAVGRATAVAERLGVPAFQASKHRDFATGKLSGFSIDEPLPEEGNLLVVDDICDGGGTFMGLAGAAAEHGVDADRLNLWVTHGIFSGRAPDIIPLAYQATYTTNSHHGHLRFPGAHVFPLLPSLRQRLIGSTT